MTLVVDVARSEDERVNYYKNLGLVLFSLILFNFDGCICLIDKLIE